MRIVRQLPGVLEIRGSDAFRAPVVVGLVLVIAAAGFALIGGGPLTLTRVGGLAAVAGTGLWLMRLGIGRNRTLQIRESPPAVLGVDGRLDVLPGSFLQLAPAPTGSGHGVQYGLELVTPAGLRTLLLAADDPAEVLRGAASIARTLGGLDVATGWGLSSGAPWVTRRDTGSPPPSGWPEPEPTDPRKLGLTIAIGAVAAMIVIAVEIRGRLLLGETPSVLELVLPALLGVILAVLALVVGTRRESIEVARSLEFERRICGLPVRRESIPSADVRAAFLCGPGGVTRHLLLETTDGPRAFSCEERRGREIVSLLGARPGAPAP